MGRLSIHKLYKHTLTNNINPVSLRTLGRLWIPNEEVIRPLKLTENQMIVGFKDHTMNPESIEILDLDIFHDHETESVAMGFLGVTGTGKTTHGYTIIEDFLFRHNYCFFGYDAKGEAYFHKQELNSLPNLSIIDSVFERLGRRRRGLDLLIIGPRYLGNQKNVDRYFACSWRIIQQIAKYNMDEALKLLVEFTGLDNSDGDSIDILREGLSKRSVQDFSDLLKFIEKLPRGPGEAGKVKLLRRIENRLASKIFSDDPELHINLLEEIKSRQGRGGVIFSGRIKTAGAGSYVDRAYNAMLMMCQNLTFYDGFSWNVDRNQNAVIKGELIEYIDEIDTLAPDVDNNLMSEFERNQATKARQAGKIFAFSVQELDTVDRSLTAQIRFFFCAKVSESNARALRRKGISGPEVETLQDLPISEQTELGYSLPWRCIIDKNNKIKIYLPIMGESQFAYKKQS